MRLFDIDSTDLVIIAEQNVFCAIWLRLTMRTKSFFIFPTKIKILHTNKVKVFKDQKMEKNQSLTWPFGRSGELIKGSWSKFS